MLDTTADIPWDIAFPPLTSDNVDNDRRLAPLADPFGSPCSSITREGLLPEIRTRAGRKVDIRKSLALESLFCARYYVETQLQRAHLFYC